MSAILPSRFPSWAERRWLPRTLPVLEGLPLPVIVLTTTIAITSAHHARPLSVPLVALIPPCLVVTMLCPIRDVWIVFGFVVAYVAYVAYVVLTSSDGLGRQLPLLVSMGLMYALAASRSRHGAAAFAGNRMLGDLRTRLLKMGEIPTLPTGWHAERSFATAHGNAFAGDFNVTSRSRCGRTPRDGPRRCQRQGAGGGHPRARPRGGDRWGHRVVRARARAPDGQRLPRARRLGRGLRHRGPRLPRHEHRGGHRLLGRSPARHALRRGLWSLVGPWTRSVAPPRASSPAPPTRRPARSCTAVTPC
uniref:Uncharacterized protein n=1 Tax=Janibacter limosus TaxID=53458 RepID=A0AC61U226_9MICO|nr:hypothetical protein [Janibacter limosus]